MSDLEKSAVSYSLIIVGINAMLAYGLMIF
jgi:hypothetical protein